jgi:RecB family endonuclease NucS
MPAKPRKTSVAERIAEQRRERAIEDLLFQYPYLIDRELSRPLRQEVLSRDSRADLLFLLPHKRVLVEIKRGVITPATVHQILRYAERLPKAKIPTVGYLIGTELTAPAQQAIEKAPIPLTFRALEREIPLTIVICRQCRQARDQRLVRCPADGNEATL